MEGLSAHTALKGLQCKLVERGCGWEAGNAASGAAAATRRRQLQHLLAPGGEAPQHIRQ